MDFTPSARDSTPSPTPAEVTASEGGGAVLALAIGVPLVLAAACLLWFLCRKKSKYECVRCGKVQDRKVLKIQDKNYKCADCGFESPFWQEHTILRKRISNRKSLKPHSCIECSTRFMLLPSEFNSNMYFSCDGCGKSGRTKEVLRDCYESKNVNIGDVEVVVNPNESYDAVNVGSLANTFAGNTNPAIDTKSVGGNRAGSIASSDRGSLTNSMPPVVEVGAHSRNRSNQFGSEMTDVASGRHTARSGLESVSVVGGAGNPIEGNAHMSV